MPIYATKVWWDREKQSGTAPCPRCGRRRKVHVSTTEPRSGLCRDCVSALTPEELELWRNDK